jgi:hypothetical protein
MGWRPGPGLNYLRAEMQPKPPTLKGKFSYKWILGVSNIMISAAQNVIGGSKYRGRLGDACVIPHETYRL